jgi:hypothetical protein
MKLDEIIRKDELYKQFEDLLDRLEIKIRNGESTMNDRLALFFLEIYFKPNSLSFFMREFPIEELEAIAKTNDYAKFTENVIAYIKNHQPKTLDNACTIILENIEMADSDPMTFMKTIITQITIGYKGHIDEIRREEYITKYQIEA